MLRELGLTNNWSVSVTLTNTATVTVNVNVNNIIYQHFGFAD